MAKKYTTKKNKLRSKAARRRQELKVNPADVIRPLTLEESNRAVIASIEAKMTA